jgi:HEAT repeat protein
MADKNSIQALLNALRDGREGVRDHAVCRLIEIGPEVIPDIIELFKEKQGFSADCATTVLVGIGPVVIPHMLEAMKHPERSVRWGAAGVLSCLGEQARSAVDSAATLTAVGNNDGSGAAAGQ